VTECLPPAFVDCLLDSALEPALDAAAQRGAQAAKPKKNAGDATEATQALLTVTVCDPACGSGSLLVAAAGRIARRVAQAREGNQSPDALRRAMREVVGSCVYGVDVSGEAVERAKDRLRIAADVPGMTLPFLDGHVRQGNALIGASPELIESGVPDEAFRPADGDDRGYARSLRRANAKPDPGQPTLFSEQGGYAHSNEALAKSLAKIGRLPGGASADDRRQAAEYRKWRDSAAFRARRLVADAWCAALRRSSRQRAAHAAPLPQGPRPPPAPCTCLAASCGAAHWRPCTTSPVPTPGSACSPWSAARRGPARFAFWLDGPAGLGDDGRSFTLTPGEAALINPNTGALPAFRGVRDAALTAAIYRRVPALWDETQAGGNPWKMRLATAYPRAAADTGLLRAERELRAEGWELAGSTFTRDGQRMLPVYEPPMVDLFDHEAAKPRYWIAEHGPVAVQRKGEAAERLGVVDRLAELGWNWKWLCAWRAPVHERTAVAVFLPRAAAAGSLPLMLPRVVPPFAAALIAAQSSLVFEYVARQKIDGPVVRATHWKQLPVPTPDMLEPHLPFIVPRVLELVYTSSDMGPFSRDLDDTGDPFAWDPDRRASLRAELDALFFCVYGINAREDAEYIIDTLQVDADGLERSKSQGDDSRRAGTLALAAYDRMTEADAGGAEYVTRIFPPPGHGPRRQLS
jgi:hypothetical protein